MSSALKLGQSRLSPPTMGQLGLINYLKSQGHPSAIEEMVKRYEKRRDVLLEELSSIKGIDYGEPQGAFYLMVSLPVADAEDFVRWMLEEFRHKGETAMMAPGEGFYESPEGGKDEVRLSYVLNAEDLVRVTELLERGLKQYGRR